VYYFIAPYLSKSRINVDCPFFDDNRITLTNRKGVTLGGIYPDYILDEDITSYPDSIDSVGMLNKLSEDLKTMTYLSTFQRSRVAYNPKNIDFYLRTLGHITYSESAVNVVCFNEGSCGDENGQITFEEWKSLS
jgi:hypothetical protein